MVPGPSGDRFVELTRSKMGRVFRKQILKWGDLLYPGVAGGVVHIDTDFADTMIANFAAGVADIVQAPKVNGKNEHTEDPDRNIGEVINIIRNEKGVYVDIDVRTDDADKMGKTLLGASAMLSVDYTDTTTQKKVGPTLIHTAITNRPYVTNLDGFEEIIAASHPGADIHDQVLVLTPADDKETDSMTLDEMIATLKAEHNIDVAALQQTAEDAGKTAALSNRIKESLVGIGLLTLSNTDDAPDADVLIGAVTEAGNKIVELTNKVDTMVKDAAETAATTEVEKLVATGYILPKKQDAMIRLRLSNPDLFTDLIPEQPIVKLSVESGQDTPDESLGVTAEGEIDRLIKVAADKGNVFVR